MGILIDQHMTSPDAIYVDFFGRPAATTSTLAALAIRTGAPVIPLFAFPLPGGRYRMIYEHPVEPPARGFSRRGSRIHAALHRCAGNARAAAPGAVALDAPPLARCAGRPALQRARHVPSGEVNVDSQKSIRPDQGISDCSAREWGPARTEQ